MDSQTVVTPPSPQLVGPPLLVPPLLVPLLLTSPPLVLPLLEVLPPVSLLVPASAPGVLLLLLQPAIAEVAANTITLASPNRRANMGPRGVLSSTAFIAITSGRVFMTLFVSRDLLGSKDEHDHALGRQRDA